MRSKDEQGAVTAETATMLPILVLVALALTWAVSLGVTQVQAVDAAREAARSLARGEDEGTSTRLAREVAPEGADVEVSEGDGVIRVEVTARVRGPGGIFGLLPGFDAHAVAVARPEP